MIADDYDPKKLNWDPADVITRISFVFKQTKKSYNPKYMQGLSRSVNKGSNSILLIKVINRFREKIRGNKIKPREPQQL